MRMIARLETLYNEIFYDSLLLRGSGTPVEDLMRQLLSNTAFKKISYKSRKCQLTKKSGTVLVANLSVIHLSYSLMVHNQYSTDMELSQRFTSGGTWRGLTQKRHRTTETSYILLFSAITYSLPDRRNSW